METNRTAAAYRTITRTAAEAKGMRVRTITAERLAEVLPADGSPTTVWEGFGTVNGQYRLGLSLMALRDNNIVCISRETGGVVGIHPLGQARTIVTLLR